MLHINDLSYRLGDRLLLDQATLMVPARTRVGVVGRNGSGKSTLLKLILGELSPLSGGVTLQKGARIGTVAQEVAGDGRSALDLVVEADRERAALLVEAETCTDPHRIGDIQTRLADIDAHSAEARAAEILSGLGFDQAMAERPSAEFSGGWRMRIALAAVLFARPDLLLLDEPTNYLDLEGAVWLEAFLRKSPSAALVISHDRDLLNGAVHKITHLRQGKLFLYDGGYDAFLRQYAEQQEHDLRFRQRQEAERRKMMAFVDRFRASAAKAAQAQSRLKRLEAMPIRAVVSEAPTPPFHLASAGRRMPPPLVRLDGVSVGYGDAPPILRGVTMSLDPEDRIGVLGRNGAGKSSLIKTICGELPPQSGHVRRHKKLSIGYFSQHQLDSLAPHHSAYDHIVERLPDATEAQRRARLGAFGLPQERGETLVCDLSGGERARLLLNLIAFEGVHLLILDEPTNHLDIDSRAALVDALNDFEGAVILITHDRALLDACADRLWVVGDGKVSPYTDTLEAYRRSLLSPPKPATADRKRAPSGGQPPHDPAKARAGLSARRSEVAAKVKEVERLTEILAIIDRGLAVEGIFERKPDEARALAEKRGRAASALEAAEQAWLDAEQALEAAMAAPAG